MEMTNVHVMHLVLLLLLLLLLLCCWLENDAVNIRHHCASALSKWKQAPSLEWVMDIEWHWHFIPPIIINSRATVLSDCCWLFCCWCQLFEAHRHQRPCAATGVVLAWCGWRVHRKHWQGHLSVGATSGAKWRNRGPLYLRFLVLCGNVCVCVFQCTHTQRQNPLLTDKKEKPS